MAGHGANDAPAGYAARKLDQSAAQKVIHWRGVHSTLLLTSGADYRKTDPFLIPRL